MTLETLIFDIKDQVAYITLNRPDAANGINLTLAKDLVQAAIHCDEHPEIRVVVIRGAGSVFSARVTDRHLLQNVSNPRLH